MNKSSEENDVENSDEEKIEDELDEMEEQEIFVDQELEFERSIEDYRNSLDDLIFEFSNIFLKNKSNIAETLKIEIKKIFNEYDSRHFNSLVLYCGRVYEFIIYQIGWYILKDAMYQTKYKNRFPEFKTLQNVINEIEGFFKKNVGHPLKNELKVFQLNLYEKRNDVAHPSVLGELRDVNLFDAEEVLKLLINSIDFFCKKFQEIIEKPNPVFI